MNTRKYFIPIVITFCGLCGFGQVKAQVLLQDSLALVALYNEVPALASDTTWLNGNVSTWHGVGVLGNRVTFLQLDNVVINDTMPEAICSLLALQNLSLSYCQLKGEIPACIFDLPDLIGLYIDVNQLTGIEAGANFSNVVQLQTISISYNEFRDMPDFLSIVSPVFNNLNVIGNYLNFDDLIPVKDKPLVQFLYSPQYEVSDYQIAYVIEGDSLDFPDASVSAGTNAPGNTYSWRIIGLADSTFTPSTDRFRNINEPVMRVEGVLPVDNRLYRCLVTNPLLPGLELVSASMSVIVTALFPQTIIYTGDTVVYCRSLNYFATAFSSGGRPVSFVSLDDSILTVNPDNRLALHGYGTARIQATTPADTMYHAASLIFEIDVVAREAIPEMEITKQLPTKIGGDLILSLPYMPGLFYRWTTPNAQIVDSATLFVSPLTAADLGTYQVSITDGTCFVSNLPITINSLVYGTPIIYELITPNGDGDNETFYIENLDPSVRNEVNVFNAVHQIVYHQENYRNDWHGSDLPVGTYYYFVKYGEQNYKGSLYIRR